MSGTVEVEVLHGIDLVLKRGEFVALIGPSGSGKSTLLKCLGAVIDPTAGRMTLGDEVIYDEGWKVRDLRALRRDKIGFVFQNFNLVPVLTALENVCLPLQVQGLPAAEIVDRASLALEQVGLGGFLKFRPDRLSGGQRQRAAIARALVSKPQLLIADEPTANLDSKTSDEIMRIFEEIHSQGNTIILVTHEPDVSLHAHRIVRLKDGAIESDTINENPVKYGIPVGVH